MAPRKVLRFLLVLVCAGCILGVIMFTRSAGLSATFVLEPSVQWIVRQERPGEIVARQTTGRRQVMQSTLVYQFNRGDLIRFNLASNLTEGAMVAAGTPVLELDSQADRATEQVLIARTNRLAQQIEVLRRGEGEARIRAAEAELALAITNLASYLPMIERRRTLVAQGVLSQDELQATEDEYNRRVQEVAVRRADVEVRRMQIAPGVVAMAEAELEEALQELRMVQARRAARWITTPIGGRLTRDSGDPLILLRVMNVEELYARVVLPITYYNQVRVGDHVELVFDGAGLERVRSRVERIEVNQVPELGQSALHVLVAVANPSNLYTINMTGRALLHVSDANPLGAIMRRLQQGGITLPWHRD